MSLVVECSCGVRKNVPDEWKGKTVKCKCGAKLVVGSNATLSNSSPPTVRPPELPQANHEALFPRLEKSESDSINVQVTTSRSDRHRKSAHRKKLPLVLVALAGIGLLALAAVGYFLINPSSLGDRAKNKDGVAESRDPPRKNRDSPVTQQQANQSEQPHSAGDGRLAQPPTLDGDRSPAEAAAREAVEAAHRENVAKLAEAESKRNRPAAGTTRQRPTPNTHKILSWANAFDPPANSPDLAKPYEKQIESLYFTPGEFNLHKLIAVDRLSEQNHQLGLIDLSTGKVNSDFESIVTKRHLSDNQYILFQDGRNILVNDQSPKPDHLFRVVSVETGKVIAETTPAHEKEGEFFADPEASGEFVVASRLSELWIWNFRTNDIRVITVPNQSVFPGNFAFSPNGRFCAFASMRQVWDPAQQVRDYCCELQLVDLAAATIVGQVSYVWDNQEAQVARCRFSPGGESIAVLLQHFFPSHPQCLVVIDTKTGEPSVVLDGLAPPSSCYTQKSLTWSPDGKHLVLGMNHLLNLEDRTVRKFELPVKPNQGPLRTSPWLIDMVPTEEPNVWLGCIIDPIPDGVSFRQRMRMEVVRIELP
jgi:hypothetical protein